MATVLEKLLGAGFEYPKNQVRWELEDLGDIQLMIQSVGFAASTHLEIKDRDLNKWLWMLRNVIDEAEDVLDDLEYKKREEQLARNNKVRSTMNSLKKIGKRDPNLKRLEAAVQKLHKFSADVRNFRHLLKNTEQWDQQLELYRERETRSLPKNDQIGREEEKEYVMEWLRKPSNEEEHQTNTLYKNISLLSIVGHAGMGKTTLLEHVIYDDEMTKEFDFKMWVCVSNNFDAKKVIADTLEYIKKERPRLETLTALQDSLRSEVMSKKFLLVLDDIWGEEEEKDKSKWEDVLAPLASGSLGSKILITTRMDSVALMIANVMVKKNETLKLEGLKNDECLLLLNSRAFAGVENPHGHKKLKSIAEEIVQKISGSPLAAKVIGGVLNSNFDERYWNKILNSGIRENLFLFLRLSYTSLPKHLQSCFAFCCIFPQNHEFDKDDLVQMWIALGFIWSFDNSEETMEDIGGSYFDFLVEKTFFRKFENRSLYKMEDIRYMLGRSIFANECIRVVDDEKLSYTNPETIRHLSIETSNLELLKSIIKFKNLRSLFLIYKGNQALVREDKQVLVEVFAKIFKALRSIRILYIYAEGLKIIPEAIGCLIHLRYLKLAQTNVVQLPKSLSKLYHLRSLIYDTDFWYVSPDILPSNMSLAGLKFDSN